MLTKLKKIDNVDEIIEQVLAMEPGHKHKFNTTDGDKLTGDYTLNPSLINTPLGNLLESLGDIGEARIMRLDSGETFLAHSDPDDRIQLVLTTNPDCYHVDLENQTLHHLPVDGQLWELDTGPRHTACNFGGTERLHLNIRKKLPKFNGSGYNINIEGGGVDWRHVLHGALIQRVNYSIKAGKITGIEICSDRNMKINCDEIEMQVLCNIITKNDFTVTVHHIP